MRRLLDIVEFLREEFSAASFRRAFLLWYMNRGGYGDREARIFARLERTREYYQAKVCTVDFYDADQVARFERTAARINRCRIRIYRLLEGLPAWEKVRK